MKLFGFRINSENPNFAAFGSIRRFIASTSGIVLSVVLALAAPASAYADYFSPSINTVAQMRTDGALHVVEQRSFSFEDTYSLIAWPFTGVDSMQSVNIASVRLIQIDDDGNILQNWLQLEEVSFNVAWRNVLHETEGISDRVRKMQESAQAKDEELWLPSPNTYSFDKVYNFLYIFLDDVDTSTIIECDYVVENAALIYDDTAELYWDYVSAQRGVRSLDVNVQIQLPVPEGVLVVPGENVLAWGHGPEGTVEVRADGTIDYLVPLVRKGQYSQAHVLFPRGWLPNLRELPKTSHWGTRFDDAVAEEAGWTDTYTSSVVNGIRIEIAFAIFCMLSIAVSACVYIAKGRERRPDCASFGASAAPGHDAARAAVGDAEVAGDVKIAIAAEVAGGAEGPDGARGPDGAEGLRVGQGASEMEGANACGMAMLSAYDAPVLSRLRRWNHASPSDFVDAVRQLQQRGVLQVVDGAGDAIGAMGSTSGAGAGSVLSDEKACVPGIAGRPSRGDVAKTRIRIAPNAKSAKLSPVERETMKVLFDLVADGYQSLSLKDVENFRRRHPDELQEAMEKWQRTLSGEVEKAGLFDRSSYRAAKRVALGAGVFALLFLLLWFMGANRILSAVTFATAVVMAVIAYNIPRRTPLGVELDEVLVSAADAPDGDNAANVSPAAEIAISSNVNKEPEWEFLEKTISFS